MKKLVEKHPEFYAPVRKIPATELNSNLSYMSYNRSAVIVTLPGGEEVCVNNCSDGYGLLPTIDIFPRLEKEMESAGYKFKGEYTTKAHAKFYVDYTLVGKEFEIGKNKDKILPLVRIQHSYNSQIQYSAILGFFREAGSSYFYGTSMPSIFFSHTLGNVEEMVEETVASIHEYLEKIPEMLENYKKMEASKVSSYESRIEEIVKATKYHQIYDELNEDVKNQLKDFNMRKANNWIIYNAFVNALNHSDDIEMQPELRVKLDQKVYSYIMETL